MNIIGKRFERLVVIKKDIDRKRHYICECDCGKIRSIDKYSLLYGASKSCGCYRDDINKENLKEKRFGKLVVVEEALKNDRGKTQWLCLCDCGDSAIVRASNLKAGRTKSCGCLVAENNVSRLSEGVANFNSVFAFYKLGAKNRSLEFEINKDEFREITQRNCYYCGESPSKAQCRPGSNGAYIYNGIDRIDNNVGYILENCVPCCYFCNRMKRDLNVNDFFDKVKNIYNKHLKGVLVE